MAYQFRLPDLGEGVVEAELLTWHVREGQQVTEDDPLCEVETDKAITDITCPVDGVVVELAAAEGERIEVGALMVTIDDGSPDTVGRPESADTGQNTGGQAPARSEDDEGAASIRATPAARRLATELGVVLEDVSPSGPQDTIVEADVRRVAEGVVVGGPEAEAGSRREPLRGVRRRIAEHLQRSHQQVPKVTVTEECDFTELVRNRGSLSFVPFVIKACIEGLRSYPELNAHLDDDTIVLYKRYDLGIAAQGADGLVVPVVRDADKRGLEDLDEEVARLAEAARTGTLKREEMLGSTFTITLAGKLGGFFATPLVNHPEVAILGVHRIAPRPAVVDGELAIRETALVSCTFDHRVTDGTRAAAFLLAVIEQLAAAPRTDVAPRPS